MFSSYSSLAHLKCTKLKNDCGASLVDSRIWHLRIVNSELQESFSGFTAKYKDHEVNFSALWESSKNNSKASLDSNASTSEGCTKYYKIDFQACVTNLEKLEKLIKAKDVQLNRLNMLVRNGYEGNV